MLSENFTPQKPRIGSRDCSAGMLDFASNKGNQALELNGFGIRIPWTGNNRHGMLSENFTLHNAERRLAGFSIMKRLVFHSLARILLELGALYKPD